MSGDGVDTLVGELRDEIGEAVRVVARYNRDGYDALYVRDDVQGRVDTYGDDVHNDLVLQGVGKERLEDLFGDDLVCSIHRFEELTAFRFVDGDTDFEGLFVSVDSDANVPLATFSDICQRQR
jgi:hypothetical protein